jgi:excinuclease ABC subunit B
MFNLTSSYKPTGDQPHAIEQLSAGVQYGLKNQVLLGVTGSGKTFTMANMIQNLDMPALIISHNKTLAGQLYQEFRDFFPTNAVSYFVSYYDYYQPEAYIPTTDTYIEKEADINEQIDKLRLQASTNILTRKDTIVVASVSCIYNIGSAEEHKNFFAAINIGDVADFRTLSVKLVELLYERSEFDFKRGTFRIRGTYMDIYPAYEDFGYRIQTTNGRISDISKFDPLTGKEIENISAKKMLVIYPAKLYLTDKTKIENAEKQIRADLAKEYKDLKDQGKIVEAERLLRKVNYDLEMIKEVGYVNGIENYSRYFDGRKPGDAPHSLVDYFRSAYGDNFLLFIDESHMTVPQIRGMYNGDFSRKRTLIDFGFRLKAAYDNRPLKFEEFYRLPSHVVYVSATPDAWEVEQSQTEARLLSSRTRSGIPLPPKDSLYKDTSHVKVQSDKLQILNQVQDDNILKLSLEHNGIATSQAPRNDNGIQPPHDGVVEQLIRPTGIVDPQIIIRPAKDEIPDLIKEIETRVKRNEKILVTTLTKKTAEDLTEYLKEKSIRAEYLHSDIHTLERSDVLDNLRKNNYDVLIGVNLLREGLDLPEVFLVAILDADKEGFLRSRTSLIQTMGRAARNISGEVIMYADQMTKSIKAAVEEIERRREYQMAYNKKHGITPQNVSKPIRERIIEQEAEFIAFDKPRGEVTEDSLDEIHVESMTPYDKKKMVKKLETEMKKQAENLNFELAIRIRDKVKEIKG